MVTLQRSQHRSYLVHEPTTIQVKEAKSTGIKVSGFPGWTPTCDAIKAGDYFEAGLLSDFRSLGLEPSSLMTGLMVGKERYCGSAAWQSFIFPSDGP